MLRIHIPEPLGGVRPFYCSEEFGCIDLVDLTILEPEQSRVAGYCVQVMPKYEDQPVLIVTTEGSYFVQSDPFRMNGAPLVAVESTILGVYPLYQLVKYKRPFNKKILNKLRWLVCKKESIFELDHFDDYNYSD